MRRKLFHGPPTLGQLPLLGMRGLPAAPPRRTPGSVVRRESRSLASNQSVGFVGTTIPRVQSAALPPASALNWGSVESSRLRRNPERPRKGPPRRKEPGSQTWALPACVWGRWCETLGGVAQSVTTGPGTFQPHPPGGGEGAPGPVGGFALCAPLELSSGSQAPSVWHLLALPLTPLPTLT